MEIVSRQLADEVFADVGVKYAERLAADIPGARLTRIQDSRHFLMFDQAAQVASEVSAFISMR